MKLSIVTVCYNGAKTIEQAIQSVLRQSNQNYEYIVIDGGSDDGTLDIIKRYEANIAYFVSEPDRGIYDAMNKGVRAARGDVIAFLNSDDWFFDYTVEKVLKEFEQGDIDVVYGDTLCIRKDAPPVYAKAEIKSIYYAPLNHQSTFARSDLFEKIGMFDLQYQIGADYDWLLKAYMKGYLFRYLPVPLANYRLDGTSGRKHSLYFEEMMNIAIKHLPEAKAEEYLPIINKAFERRNKTAAAGDEVYRLFEEDCQSLIHLLSDFVKPSETVYVWGFGLWGGRCLAWLKAMGVNVRAIIDSDSSKWQQPTDGIEVAAPLILLDEHHKVIVTSPNHESEISQQLEEWGYEKQSGYVLFSEMIDCIVESIRNDGDVYFCSQ
jgi:glycosyltransferase involved in cell wall biosynthesis